MGISFCQVNKSLSRISLKYVSKVLVLELSVIRHPGFIAGLFVRWAVLPVTMFIRKEHVNFSEISTKNFRTDDVSDRDTCLKVRDGK